MRTVTSKFVTIFDVFIVVGVCLSAMVSGMLAMKNVQSLNRKLKDCDRELSLLNDKSRDKKRGIILICVVLTAMTGMIILDIASRARKQVKLKEKSIGREIDDDEINDITEVAAIDMISYFPFYILYYVMMSLQIQIAQTALGVARRYQRLNMAIQSAFSLSEKGELIFFPYSIYLLI